MTLENLGFHFSSTASPGGSGALYLSANNFLDKGQSVLLRDRHWGPYKGFLQNNSLVTRLGHFFLQNGNDSHPFFAKEEFEVKLAELCSKARQSNGLAKRSCPQSNRTFHEPKGTFGLFGIIC